MDGQPRVHALIAAVAIALTTAVTGQALGVLEPMQRQQATPPPAAGSGRALVPGASYRHYVALGDSFTSGPLIPQVRADPLGCARSTSNYPAILAGRLGVRTFADASCGGARTDHMTEPQPTTAGTNPPQLDALSERTDLVTLSIGGNDEGVFSGLIETCRRLRATDPAGSPCEEEFSPAGLDEIEPRIDRTEQRISGVVEEIHRRAPRAIVLVVGYPRLAPPLGYCPDLLPFAYGDYAYTDRIQRALNDALAGAAERTNATYVDTYGPSLGHDICAGEGLAWVNGKDTKPSTALAFHPFRSAMVAEADLIERAIGASTGSASGEPTPQDVPVADEAQALRLARRLAGGGDQPPS